MADKVIVTNWSALEKKYGRGLPRIRRALARLIAADQEERGITTEVVGLDSRVEMGSARRRAVTQADDEAQVKAAVDAVHAAHTPDYLMILGAWDVVPMQQLRNPVRDDEDKTVPSDIPYACAAPFDRDPARFLGPTRVLGRLPDLVGRKDPAYLVSLLGTAARSSSRPRKEYQRYFGLSAEVWKVSTALSLIKVFGTAEEILSSPPRGPSWRNAQLAPRAHFINCHGGASDPKYYGQPAERVRYPDAHRASRLPGRVSNGTVIAAECCYGAELYDPKDSRGQPGICSTYLADGAYGFFGSTTIAYGPSEGNGQADLICQFFLSAVLDGASLGRAALEARQRFAALHTHMDPTDLKTMVQFYLLGDPSVHAVAGASHAFSRSKTFQRVFHGAKATPGARAFRRERLARTGANLQRTLGAVEPSRARAPSGVAKTLSQAANESGIIRVLGRQAYSVVFPPSASAGVKRFAAARRKRQVFALVGRKSTRGRVKRTVVLVATVENGNIVHMRRVHSR